MGWLSVGETGAQRRAGHAATEEPPVRRCSGRLAPAITRRARPRVVEAMPWHPIVLHRAGSPDAADSDDAPAPVRWGRQWTVRTTVEALHARARPDDQMATLFASGWPAFITADERAAEYIGRVRELFSGLELVALDSADVLIGAIWGVPIRWNGDPADLPDGYTASIIRAVQGYEWGERPDTLVVMAAQVHPERRGQGTAAALVTGMRDLAESGGLDRMIVPLRPTLKVRYPLTPIDRFALWTRSDGSPLDPWVRTHWRLGGRIVATTPRSQTFTGTVAQWEMWTGILLPESGTYVIPEALATLHVDRDADLATLVEPGVWIQHR